MYVDVVCGSGNGGFGARVSFDRKLGSAGSFSEGVGEIMWRP